MGSDSPEDSSILPEGWTWEDVGHGTLDIVGLIPLFGEGADLTNAAWYAAEGQYLDAGLSIISMVPIVGDAIGKGGKLLKKGGGVLAGPALKALKGMDFGKMLAPLATHPKIGPYVDKIAEALEKWRKVVVAEAPAVTPSGLTPCAEASKALGESAIMVGKTPVPTRILKDLSQDELRVLHDAIARVEVMPVPRPDRAIFYSGKIGDTYAYKIAEDAALSGERDSVNTLTRDLLNADNIRKLLPRDAMKFVDDLASERLARTASGDINFMGELATINEASVFRTIELPSLLSNPNISEASRSMLRDMKSFLDAKYGL